MIDFGSDSLKFRCRGETWDQHILVQLILDDRTFIFSSCIMFSINHWLSGWNFYFLNHMLWFNQKVHLQTMNSLSLELLIDFYHFDKAPLDFQALWKPAVFYFIDMFNTITGDIAKIDQGQPHLAEKKAWQLNTMKPVTELYMYWQNWKYIQWVLFSDCSRQFCFNKSIQLLLQLIQNAPEPVEF